jgi:predicted adenylyl cyclase CyaB
MDEIEVKIINEDFSKLRAKLKQLGAKKTFKGKLSTYYIDHPDLRLAKSKKVLRLRYVENDGAYMCFKDTQKDDQISVYEEFEVKVEDLNKSMSILKLSGLIISDRIEKIRETYILEGEEIVFDCLSGAFAEFVPEYMEIEAESEQNLLKIIKKLGIKKENVKAWNSHELIDYYRKLTTKKR